MSDTPDFGRTVFWDTDLDPRGQMISGVLVVSQRLVRRFMTVSGSAPDCPLDGLDLVDLLSVGMTANAIKTAEGRIRSEALKDEAVSSAIVTVVWAPLTASFTVTIRCTTAAGPFSLVLSVDKVTVQLLEAA